MGSFLRILAGLAVSAIVLAVVALRIIFGLALYIIAFGAAWLILVEAGIL